MAASGAQAVQSVAEAATVRRRLAPAFEQAAPEAGAAVQAALTQAQGLPGKGMPGSWPWRVGGRTAMLQGSFRLAVQAAQDGRVADARACFNCAISAPHPPDAPGAGATLSWTPGQAAAVPPDAGKPCVWICWTPTR
jgi:hypothetical protein